MDQHAGPRFEIEPAAGLRRPRWLEYVMWAVLGGLYASALTAVTLAFEPARRHVAVTATICAVMGGLLVGQYGRLVHSVGRGRVAGALLSLAVVFLCALLGGLLAMIGYTVAGSVPGAIGGWFVGRFTATPAVRRLAQALGGVLGALLGTLLYVLQRHAGVLTMAMWALAIGAVAGPLVVALFTRALGATPEE